MPAIEVVRTYVEMLSPADLRAALLPDRDFTVELVKPCPPRLYRQLYAEVGRRYHWVDRLAWTDEQITTYLGESGATIWILRRGGGLAGYFELVAHADGSIEIAYFGLVDAFLGRGLGKYLLTVAVRHAWEMGASRVWLHTCTLDHPAALPNYLARGFREYKRETYVTEVSSEL
jgi:GNAT superfamily N-acetyltransferase